MVDAEREIGAIRHRRARSTDLWLEKARRHAGEHHLRRKAMQARYFHRTRVSRDFGVVPFNGESDRSVTQYAEIIAIVRVLRDPLARKDQVSPECLFQAGVKFVAASGARKYQIFVERRFQSTRIGNAENRVGLFDIVRDPETRFGLPRNG